MAKDDPHTIAFNLSRSIGSNTRVPTLFTNYYEVRVLYMEDYITIIEKHGSYIQKSITESPHKFTKTKEPVYSLIEYENIHENYIDNTVE